MPGLQPNDGGFRHALLKEYLSVWPIERLRAMTLPEYTQLNSRDTFCYWLEREGEPLGAIQSGPSNKFGIWMRRNQEPFRSEDFTTDGVYAWRSKYGPTAQQAFEEVKRLVISIAECSSHGDFRAIDVIDIDSLFKWKIAFLYSNYQLLPVYKKEGVRAIARFFEHPNYEKGRLSELSTFIVKQKPLEEDLFDFAYRLYISLTQEQQHGYYVIGTKYEDDEGEDTRDIMPAMLARSVIATGFFSSTDFTHLFHHSRQQINKWCDKHLDVSEEKFATAKRTLSLFLNLKVGDIVAVKSHGRFNRLTIVAYAEVTEVDGKVYEHDPHGLGHIVHVSFLETGLSIETGLNYAHTIHEIVPGAKSGHFEKIFGSYAQLNLSGDIEDETSPVLEGLQGRINQKSSEPFQRTVAAYTATIAKVHDNLQMAFANHLSSQFPKDTVCTEWRFVDIRRENATDLFLYEVKPFNSAYQCIRAGIGQLLDYCHSEKDSSKTKHLIIVGTLAANESDRKFIEFVRSVINISFEYIAFSNAKVV